MKSNTRQASASDYNRTHDPLLRGWTRKQPRRSPSKRRITFVAAAVVIVIAVFIATITTARGQIVIIDPWPQIECTPGAACYFAWLPGVWQ